MDIRCPNCNHPAPKNADDMYEEPEIFNRFWRTWYYVCPDCGAAYRHSRIYSCISEEVELIEEDEDETYES